MGSDPVPSITVAHHGLGMMATAADGVAGEHIAHYRSYGEPMDGQSFCIHVSKNIYTYRTSELQCCINNVYCPPAAPKIN